MKAGFAAYGRWFVALAVLLAIPAVAQSGFTVANGDSIKHFGLIPLVKMGGDGPQFVHTANYVESEATQPVKLLLVSFWASWCEPCKKELPLLQEYYTRYKDQGLMVFAVSLDNESGGIEAARQVIEKLKPDFPVLSDRRQLVTRQYFDDNVNLPAMLLITGDGRIAKAHCGYSEDFPRQLETDVRSLLGLSPLAPAAPAVDTQPPAPGPAGDAGAATLPPAGKTGRTGRTHK